MESDSAYSATMRTLCHVYVDRDTLLATLAKEDSARSRWLLVAAALWSTANESEKALEHIEHNAPNLQFMRDSIAANAENSRATSYSFYCNAGFGTPDASTEDRDIELSQPNLPSAWDAAVQSVQPNGEDAVLDLFKDIPCTQ